ncbi:MAG: hypothetical protein BWX66_00655 [Deltaproteobacteria bacterium ADurb.Bin058]|nr:MAG: hypothetical protein BWX66_00655 [Deltaproteobacteria bacterium ADurb.Bin058]
MPETAPHRSIHRSRRQCCCMFPQPVFLRYILPSYPRCMSRYHYRCQSRLLSSKPATGPRQPCHRSCRQCYCMFPQPVFLRYIPPNYQRCTFQYRYRCRGRSSPSMSATGPHQPYRRSCHRCYCMFPQQGFLHYILPSCQRCMSRYHYRCRRRS